MTESLGASLAVNAEETDAAARMRRREARTRLSLAGMAALLIACLLLSVGLGAVAIPPLEALSVLSARLGLGALTDHTPVQETVLWSLRLPRALLGVLVGAALAISGAAMQGLFRNPLADPGLIGVSTGAALAAALVIVLGGAVPFGLGTIPGDLLLPLAAFGGGLVAVALVYRIASHDGRTEVATMLLAGIALNAVAGAAIGVLVFISDDQALRDLNFWLLGSLGGVTWDRLLLVAPLMLGPALLTLALARPLNALLFGETDALHLGIDVEQTKRLVVLLSALAVGSSVALTGVIGFVGLVVPHLVRLTIGPDHRVLLPAALMLGPSLLLLADLLARTLVLPAELPIGILTSCVGGPFFLWLLLRRRGLGIW
ncbi:FecCD family ABC transporter permease [Roseospira visakhapatnamensis]|uniref:Iron complex transport system permease protein n=1 Tax=Roseospira visakhapatnamensis TaxID=390880 RepID=A0A7W6RG70_9PROT|nr:iron chelate uptake ABC transporter family permease subunit [Roseospira visakhapatnamensis]MBB4267984.1 iron complex transport system permease protein [Roseospira visakhapatnamensis]